MVAWKRQMRVDSEMYAGAHLNDFNCHLDAPRFFIPNIERRTRHVRNRQISRRIKKHLWLSNRSWARDVHSFGILHSWGALAGKSCSAQASSIWLIAGAFRRTQSK